MKPLVTISFIHYSEVGGYSTIHHIRPFLESIFAQTYRNIEVFCVENASNDLRYKEILAEFPKVTLIKLPKNLGTCAHNVVISKAKGEFVWCTTLDTRYEPNYLEKLVASAEKLPDGASFGGTLFRMNSDTLEKTDEIDTQGILATKAHQFHERNTRLHIKQENLIEHPVSVFAISGATVLYRKSALDSIKYEDGTHFDETFFMYKEDIDVGYRLLWQGWKNYCIPNVIGYHVRSVVEKNIAINKTTSSMLNRFNKSDFGATLSYRNHLYLLYKNYSRDYPSLILFLTGFYFLGRIMFAFVFEPRLRKAYGEFNENSKTLRISPKKITGKAMAQYFE